MIDKCECGVASRFFDNTGCRICSGCGRVHNTEDRPETCSGLTTEQAQEIAWCLTRMWSIGETYVSLPDKNNAGWGEAELRSRDCLSVLKHVLNRGGKS